MKRTLIGGFLSLIGTIWGFAVIIYVGNNLVSDWHTPPGRFLISLSESGMTLPLAISLLFTVIGIVILCVEFFRKDR